MSETNDGKSISADVDEVRDAIRWMLEHYGIVEVKEFVQVDFNTIYRARDGKTDRMQAGTRTRILRGYELAKAALGEVRSDARNSRTEDRMIEAYRENAAAYDLPSWDSLTDREKEAWERHWRAFRTRLEAAEIGFLQVAMGDFAVYLRASRR